jgi:hypothetical protein
MTLTEEQALAGYEVLLRRMEEGDFVAKMWVEGLPSLPDMGVETQWARGIELATAMLPCVAAAQVSEAVRRSLSESFDIPVSGLGTSAALLEAVGIE